MPDLTGRRGEQTVTRDIVRVSVQFGGRQVDLYCPEGETITRELARSGVWERHLSSFFIHSLWRKTGVVFFDVGANFGYYSVLAGMLMQSGRVVAVEPQSGLLALLKKNLGNLSAIETSLEHRAVGATGGTVRIAADLEDSGGAHRADDGEEVALVTLDDLSGRHGLPSLIKMDIEGMEGDAIAGGERTFREGSPAICMEFQPGAFFRSDNDLFEQMVLLESLGYRFHFFRGHSNHAAEPISAQLLKELVAYWRSIGVEKVHMDLLCAKV